jgi:cytidine deaminase
LSVADIDWAALRSAAIAVRDNAYAPYSNFPVGAAALVDDGRVVVGCNVENAAYGVVLCAECGVVSSLHSSGGGRIVALSCVDRSGEPLMPCGRCRQLLWENGGPDCLVEAVPAPLRMDQLLPEAFGPENLHVAPASPTAVPPSLQRWRGRGTVFIHTDSAGGSQLWTGYWDRSNGGSVEGSGILEEAPTWADPDEGIAWGAARTPRVVVVDADGVTWWAGEGEPPAEVGARWRA